MDLQYIAAQLLAEEEQDQELTPVSTPEVALLPAPISPVSILKNFVPSPISGPKTKVSILEYLQRKKELNEMTAGTVSHRNEEESESESEEESSSSEEEEPEEAEDVNERDLALFEDLDEFGQLSASAVPRTKNELATFPPVEPPAVVLIPSHLRLIKVGTIHAVIDNLVVIQSDVIENGSDNIALDIGSILAFSDHHVLGEIFETFGPITQPFYSILYNSAADIDLERTKKGEAVFQCLEFSRAVFIAALRALKGTDASNIHDEEVDENELEFSDDEAEREAKLKKKGKRKRVDVVSNVQTQFIGSHVPRGELSISSATGR